MCNAMDHMDRRALDQVTGWVSKAGVMGTYNRHIICRNRAHAACGLGRAPVDEPEPVGTAEMPLKTRGRRIQRPCAL